MNELVQFGFVMLPAIYIGGEFISESDFSIDTRTIRRIGGLIASVLPIVLMAVSEGISGDMLLLASPVIAGVALGMIIRFLGYWPQEI